MLKVRSTTTVFVRCNPLAAFAARIRWPPLLLRSLAPKGESIVDPHFVITVVCCRG